MKHAVALVILMTTQAAAHHGWSEYDAGQPLQLVGAIQESGYVHPHGFTRLKTADKTWLVILAPPTRLENRGVSKEMLAPGSHISVYGYPNRNNPDELRAERITIGEKTTELR